MGRKIKLNVYFSLYFSATINLPPGTRIQQATIIPNESSGATVQQQPDATTATASANIYGQHIYQQHAVANTPATYVQTGYGQTAQITPTGQYYYKYVLD